MTKFEPTNGEEFAHKYAGSLVRIRTSSGRHHNLDHLQLRVVAFIKGSGMIALQAQNGKNSPCPPGWTAAVNQFGPLTACTAAWWKDLEVVEEPTSAEAFARKHADKIAHSKGTGFYKGRVVAFDAKRGNIALHKDDYCGNVPLSNNWTSVSEILTAYTAIRWEYLEIVESSKPELRKIEARQMAKGVSFVQTNFRDNEEIRRALEQADGKYDFDPSGNVLPSKVENPLLTTTKMSLDHLFDLSAYLLREPVMAAKHSEIIRLVKAAVKAEEEKTEK